MKRIQRLFKEPLLHFLALGAVIFAVNAWREKTRPTEMSAMRIEVTAAIIERLKAGYERQFGQVPDVEELRGLVTAHVREEVLCREALALGLDRDDTIVRRRLAQKMEFLTDDIATAAEPEDNVVRAFFEQNAARYAKPAQVSFRHVYFSKEKRGARSEAAAREAFAALAGGASDETMGDPFLHGYVFAKRETQDVTALFGAEFAARLTTLREGEWSGPIESSYGLHLVRIDARGAVQPANFETVRTSVARDFNEERRRKANREVFEKLRERYQVAVDEAALAKASPPCTDGPTMKYWLTIALLLVAVRLTAHEVRPAFLELTERAPGEFDVLWKVPAAGGMPLAGEEIPHEPSALLDDPAAPKTMPCGCPAPTAAQLSRGVLPIHPSLPADAAMVGLPRSERIFGAEVKRWTVRVPQGLDGWQVTVHGLPSTMVDVLVRVAFKDGRVVSRMLRPDAPSFAFSKEIAGPAAGGYFRLGVEHILLGIDHLLFVLALVLIVRGVGLLVKTITAFTVAHSVTLGLATLGVVHVPSAPVEAVIALSIVYVASEILRRKRGERGLTERAPWLVAGAFGLLHGFGFAGALSQVGLPANDIPLALFFFNLGVEAGQLAFVVVALGVIALLRRWRLPEWAPFLPPYAIGGIAMYWVIIRTGAIW